MSCSPAQLAANRVNCLKSTGPRTKRGKRKASRNSTKHAIYCQQTVVPGESKMLFELIRQKFIRDLKPQNDVELSIVDRIAMAQWKLRRIQSAEMAFYCRGYETFTARAMEQLEQRGFSEEQIQAFGEHVSQDPDMPGRIALDGISGNLDKLSRLEQRLEMSVHRWMRELERVRKLSEKSEDLPRSEYDMLDETIEESAAMRRRIRRQRRIAKEEEARKSALVEVEEEKSEVGSIEPLDAPGTGETPVSRVSDHAEEESSSVPRASRACGENQLEGADEEANKADEPITGETPVVQEKECTSNIQNEANDVLVRYVPRVVGLRRENRVAKEVETKPIETMAEATARCAAEMARVLGVPIQTFDGMSIDGIKDQVKRILTDRGDQEALREFDWVGWEWFARRRNTAVAVEPAQFGQ